MRQQINLRVWVHHRERTPRAEIRREAVRDVLVRIEAVVATQPEFDRLDTDRTFRLLPLPPIHWRGSGTNTGIWALA